MDTNHSKEPFKFAWVKPTLDWFDIVHVEVEYEDYAYFKLERRFDNSWWLVGTKPCENDNGFEVVELGEVPAVDVPAFLDWCQHDGGRKSKLTEIESISSDFNVFKELFDIKLKYDSKR